MKILNDICLPILKLALPLMLIQICQASLGVMNTMLAGRYHYIDLAGIGLGSNMWTPVFILFTGILYVLVPKISAMHQGASEEIEVLIQQGKKVACLLSVLGFHLIHLLAFLSPSIIENPQVALITQQYLHFVAFAVPGLVYMTLFRFIGEGRCALKPIMLTYAILLLCDVLLCLALVNGIGFIPEMGGVGTGLATAISAYIACFCMYKFVVKAVPELKVKNAAGVSFSESLALLKQGLPIGITLVLQILALATLAFFASQLGAKTIAAHQIAINIAMLLIMIPIAISSATTIRISYFSAIDQQQGKMATGFAVAVITLIYVALTSGLLFGFSAQITALFSQDAEVLHIANTLMVFVAIFLIFDALQTVASGVLRGLQQFMQPLFVILFCYWFIIIPMSYFMGVKGWLLTEANVNVIWMVLTGGICLAAILLTLQSYRYLTRHSKRDHLTDLS